MTGGIRNPTGKLWVVGEYRRKDGELNRLIGSKGGRPFSSENAGRTKARRLRLLNQEFNYVAIPLEPLDADMLVPGTEHETGRA